LSRVSAWLDQLISVRQQALVQLQGTVEGANQLGRVDRTQLTAIVTAATSQLSTISTRALNDERVSSVATQAQLIINLQILGVIVPQVRDLSRADVLFNKTQTLSSKESAAVAAIAITHQSSAQVASEQTLDVAVQSLVGSNLTTLELYQHALEGLSAQSRVTAPGIFAGALTTITTSTKQLSTAERDLRLLVRDLAA
jgi:hypothetical protein